ncbi:hypothetical protein AQUCO_02300047v1 [Aquilegia coerulea]|uniref:J domain-containing protein n=1 Tax=Aquilegia coerulea TaxID=218851 RepID=A0A2G5DBU2_AQUCA|nr:hypothetical protein AQUCO_02300047v1 [Aquilegia coerulea]
MDHYKVLGLNNNATKAQIKEAFRKLALKFHPDKHSHSTKIIRDNALLHFKQASEAYEVLIDDTKRAHYNQTFRGATSTSTSGFYGYGYYNNHNYYYATRNQTAYRPHYGGRGPSPNSVFKWGLHLDATLRFLTMCY